MRPCVSCVPVDLYVLSLRCYRLVLRPVKAMLDRNFRCTVTEYVLAPCSMRKPRAKSVDGSRARVHTEQDDLWADQLVAHSLSLTAISSAIQRADAQTILRLATDLALSTVT